MGKNINVNLQFTANTASARANLQALQRELTQLSATPIAGSGITDKLSQELSKATQDAISLKLALERSTNVDTGKLNFNKFSQELKTSKITLEDYAISLSKLGPQGAEAFMNLSKAIRQAETPMISLEGQMRKLGTTMANTIRWQITASITTGMVSAFSSVIDYAEDLNKSLTEIQYVTGKNIDSMSKFADQAQKAAKSLSSSTLDYADSALLYAQQGLDDQQIKERTAITLKLAQVVNESGSTVSDWMTSIWNNFDDGSHSLEYYADVLTKLGAATASSADEIAGGLEKFSSIADTVGLSYEYAAAAVTTITAKTRQSEDVVGTSLKTIFSRMEDLELGNTLDDGTTLGQYSAALATAGVKVKDVNGNLRDMDDILDDIMDAWGGLTQAQKVSLAQSVSGVRQYSQFMALIDNADAFKENVNYAKESTGELEKEFTYYENSVAGAKARVENDLEAIKNTFLDENTLVPLLNTLDTMLSFVEDLLDAFGGLPGILLIVASLMEKAFGAQMANLMRNTVSTVKGIWGGLSGKTQQNQKSMVEQSTEASRRMAANGMPEKEGGSMVAALEREAKIDELLLENSDKISENNMAQIEQQRTILELLEKQNRELAKRADEAKDRVSKSTDDIYKTTGWTKKQTEYKVFDPINKAAKTQNKIDSIQTGEYDFKTADEIFEVLKDSPVVTNTQRATLKRGHTGLEKIDEARTAVNETRKDISSAKKQGKNTDGLNEKLQEQKKILEDTQKKYSNASKTFAEAAKNTDYYRKRVEKLIDTTKDGVDNQEDYSKAVKKYAKGIMDSKEANEELSDSNKNVEQTTKNLEESIRGAAAEGQNWATRTTSIISGLTNLAMGLNMVSSGFESLTTSIRDGDFSGFLSSIMSIGFGLTSLIPVISSVSSALNGWNTVRKISNLLAQEGNDQEKVKQVLTKKGMTEEQAKILVEKAANRQTEKNIQKDKQEGNSAIANGVKKLFGWAMADPIVRIPIALGLLTIAGAAVVGVSSSISSGKEEKHQAATEQAQNEYTQKSETVEENQEKITSFTDSYIAYRKTGEGVDDLKASMDELSAVYGKNKLALAALAEDYEGFIEILKKLENEELEAAITAAQAAKNYNEIDYKEAATSGRGTTNFANAGAEYSISFKNKGSDDDSALYEAINSEDVQKLLDENSDISIGTNNGNIDVDLKTYSAENLSDMVEILTLIKNTAKENGQTDTKLYGNIVAKLANLSEFYEKDREYKNEILEDELNKAFNNTTVNGKGLEDLDTTSEYAQFYQQIKEQFAGNWTDVESLYNSLISAYSNVADYNSYLQAAKAQAEQSGGKIDEDELFETYSNVDKATAKALTKVDFSSVGTITDALIEAEKYRAEAQEDIAKGIAQDVGKTSDDEITYAKILKDNNKKLKENAEALQVVTGESIRLNAKLETLTKTYNDNADALLNGKINSTEYAYAIEAVANDLASFLNTDADLSNYVRKNRQTVAEFLNGNYELFDDIQMGVAKSIASSKGYLDELDFAFSAFQGLKAGDIVDDENTIKSFNDILTAGWLTAEQLQAIFEPMGIEFKINSENQVLSAMQTSDSSYLSESLAEEQKKKAKKRKLDLEDELERYHEINEALDDIARELDIVSEAKERAFGNAKLGYLDQEIAKQKESLSLEKQKLAEAQAYYKSDRAALLKYGATLDEDGRISNYDELIKAQVNKVNAASNSDDAYEAAKEAYDKFKDVLDNYEDSLNTIEEQQQAVIEAQYELQDLALEKIQYTVEFKIEGLEDTLKEIEFLMQEVENDAFAAATSIALAGQQANNTLQQINVNSQGIKDVEAALKAGTIATEDGIEQLREYRNELIDLNSELLELRETVKEELTEAFEAWNEKLEDNVSILEHCTALLDGYKSIIDLVGKDMLGISDEVISALNQAKLSNANDIITSTRAQLEANNAVLADYRAKRASARTDEEREDWDEQIKLAEEKSRELEETLQESLEAGLEAAIGVFEGTVDQIADNFSKAVSGIADSLSELQEMFERQEEVAERYLENYERTYELNKLNRQINQQLSNTKYTKELLELQEELSEYAESDEKMSKNQLTQKQKYYDLLVAEIALREAENNKSVVRLRRDSEGNYGYVYTADQDAIADAQQKYEDALYAYQDFIHNFETEMSQMWIELDAQREEQIRAAAEQYGEGTEEFIEAQKRINEQFEEDTRYITAQYSWMCDQNKKVNAEFQAGVAQTYNETMLGQIYPDYAEFADLYDETLKANRTASEELEAAMVALGTTISDEFELAGIDTNDFSSEFIAKFQAIVNQSNTTATTIEDFADDMVTAMEKAANSAKSFYNTYNAQMEAVRKATSSTITSVNSLISKYAELAAAENNSSNKSNQGTSSGGTGGETGDTVSADDDVKTTTIGNQQKVKATGLTTMGTQYYQLEDGKWYTLSQLNASKQGHTTKGDSVTVKKGETGISSPYETYSLKSILDSKSKMDKNAERYALYNQDGSKQTNAIKWKNWRAIGNKTLVGYKLMSDGTNLYKFDSPLEVYVQSDGEKFKSYWINQTDLHQLLGKSGQPALYKSVALQKYDTGGYTGDWNTADGKLALLHEKELVLNKNETADFLRMTEQFRNIIANYDYQAAMKQIEFSLSAGAPPNGTPQSIVQDVNISASFPNATNHSEIEQAFKNLINLSSQYVNRKS